MLLSYKFSMSQKRWKIEKAIQCGNAYTIPCLLNNQYAIISSNSHKGHVYSLNIHNSEWFEIGKLNIEPLKHSAVIDNPHQKLYVYTSGTTSSDMLLEFDIKTKSCITYKGVLHGLPEGLGSESGGNVELCILNNTLHAIGGYSMCYHSVWPLALEPNTHIRSFVSKPIGNRPKNQTLYGHSLIALHSLQQILIFGGRDNSLFGGYLHDIWAMSCDLSWTKLQNTKLPNRMMDFGCVKTNDECHIVLFGGKTASALKDDIWILSTRTWQWTKSNIKCPKRSRYYALLTKTNDIHLFGIGSQNSDVNHWKMNLSHLRLETKEESVAVMQTELVSSNTNGCALTQQVVDATNKLRLLQKQYAHEERMWNMKQNELQQSLAKVSEDYQQLNDKYNQLLKKYKRKTLWDTVRYRHWSYSQIVEWISYLEGGRFQKYLKTLEKNLKIEKMMGEFLPELDKHDIHRLGVTEYADKKALLKHCHSLDQTQTVLNDEIVFAHIVI
eukprot:220890_1